MNEMCVHFKCCLHKITVRAMFTRCSDAYSPFLWWRSCVRKLPPTAKISLAGRGLPVTALSSSTERRGWQSSFLLERSRVQFSAGRAVTRSYYVKFFVGFSSYFRPVPIQYRIEAKTASFHTLSNSLFTNLTTIRRYTA